MSNFSSLAKRLISVCFCALVYIGLSGLTTAHAVDRGAPPNEGRTVLVRINSHNGEVRGTGAWLETGQVLTASHLFLDIKPENLPRIDIVWKGVVLQAKLKRADDPSVLDAALLTVVDETSQMPSWRGSPLKICSTPLKPAQPVLVGLVLPEGPVLYLNTYGSPDGVDMLGSEKGTSAITAFLPPGASGASVYDKASGCLVGLISQQEKLDLTYAEVYVTRMVQAKALKAFVESKTGVEYP